MQGLTIREAAQELQVSYRTVFRMLHGGKLKAEKWGLPDGRFYWLINPMDIARIQVRKEMEAERKSNRKTKVRRSNVRG